MDGRGSCKKFEAKKSEIGFGLSDANDELFDEASESSKVLEKKIEFCRTLFEHTRLFAPERFDKFEDEFESSDSSMALQSSREKCRCRFFKFGISSQEFSNIFGVAGSEARSDVKPKKCRASMDLEISSK